MKRASLGFKIFRIITYIPFTVLLIFITLGLFQLLFDLRRFFNSSEQLIFIIIISICLLPYFILYKLIKNFKKYRWKFHIFLLLFCFLYILLALIFTGRPSEFWTPYVITYSTNQFTNSCNLNIKRGTYSKPFLNKDGCSGDINTLTTLANNTPEIISICKLHCPEGKGVLCEMPTNIQNLTLRCSDLI